MKIKFMRKIMSLALSALAAITCLIGPMQTKAATSSTEDWRIGIRFKLRAIHNYFYKDWWQIDLVCRDGILSLEGRTDIPSNLMFDDIFIIGFTDKGTRNSTWLPFTTYDSKSASYVLQKEMAEFNAAKIEVGEPIYIHGYYWDSTLRFADTDGVINQTSLNTYAYGYRTVDKWNTGFLVTKEGLTEILYIHSGSDAKYMIWDYIQANEKGTYTGVPVSY